MDKIEILEQKIKAVTQQLKALKEEREKLKAEIKFLEEERKNALNIAKEYESWLEQKKQIARRIEKLIKRVNAISDNGNLYLDQQQLL